MNSSKILRSFLLMGLFLTLVNPSAARTAAAQTPTTGSTIYLPVINNQSSPFTGSLSNGGVYIGAGGVGLGALDTSLTGSITVTIVKTGAPSPTMPPRAQIISDYYQVSADTQVPLSPDSPLILAFPLPPGANTTNLALAVFQADPGLIDFDGTTPSWYFLEGVYDPAKQLFLTTIAGLDQAGMTIALVDHPDLESPSNTAAANKASLAQPQVQQFVVTCLNFTNPADCTTTTEITVEGYLGDIYNHIQGDLGFQKPRLRYLDNSIDLRFSPNQWAANGYKAYIEPYDQGDCGFSHAGGLYSRFPGRLVLCMNPAVGLGPEAVNDLVHQYFHATQYGYLQVMNSWYLGQDEMWFIEGQAKAVEESFFSTEMLRSLLGGWVNLHKVDVSLKSDKNFDEYYAQDFWVYAGQSVAAGMAYLDSVLPAGARATDVVKVLDFGQYLEVYWQYVKNQFMEETIHQSGAAGSPCFLYTQVVNQLVDFNYDFYNHVFQILDPLGPLTSAVIEIHFDHDYTGADGTANPVDPYDDVARGALRYKYYKEGESGCESVPDGRRIFINIDKTARYFVVVTNVDPTNTYDYLVRIETWPIPPPP